MATKLITNLDSTDTFTVLATSLSDGDTDASDILEISGDWTVRDLAAAIVADDNITIRAKAGDEAEHLGFDDDGANYALEVASGHCLTVNNTGLLVEGIIIKLNQTTTSAECVRYTPASSTVTFKRVIFWAGTAGSSQQDGFYNANLALTANFEQCYFIGFGRAGIHDQDLSGSPVTQTYNVNSCGFWNNGIEGAGGGIHIRAQVSSSTRTINVFNTWALDNSDTTSNDFNQESTNGTTNWNIEYSIDSDNSINARDSGGVGNLASRTIFDTSPSGEFVLVSDISSAPYNLKLITNANNDAEQAHQVDDANGLNMPTTDIAGTTRVSGGDPAQGDDYDIGPFEIVVAAAPLTPPEIITMLNRDKINPIRLM